MREKTCMYHSLAKKTQQHRNKQGTLENSNLEKTQLKVLLEQIISHITMS